MTNLPEHQEAAAAFVALSEVVDRPGFDADLRALILSMSAAPGSIRLADVLATLRLDPQALAERLVADALAGEIDRLAAADAANRSALN